MTPPFILLGAGTDARLRDVLEVIYRQFAAPAPWVIEGCPCCIGKRGVDVLLTTPLRELTGQALWSYVGGVFYTVGSERDFKYLLPRILEVAITDPGTSIDPEIVLGKIGLAGWQTWPVGQRRAVEEVVDVWFERAIARDLEDVDDDSIGREAESVLCGTARAGIPLTQQLVRLQQPDAAPILADLKRRSPDNLSAFWEDALAGYEQLLEVTMQKQ